MRRASLIVGALMVTLMGTGIGAASAQVPERVNSFDSVVFCTDGSTVFSDVTSNLALFAVLLAFGMLLHLRSELCRQ